MPVAAAGQQPATGDCSQQLWRWLYPCPFMYATPLLLCLIASWSVAAAASSGGNSGRLIGSGGCALPLLAATTPRCGPTQVQRVFQADGQTLSTVPASMLIFTRLLLAAHLSDSAVVAGPLGVPQELLQAAAKRVLAALGLSAKQAWSSPPATPLCQAWMGPSPAAWPCLKTQQLLLQHLCLLAALVAAAGACTGS